MSSPLFLNQVSARSSKNKQRTKRALRILNKARPVQAMVLREVQLSSHHSSRHGRTTQVLRENESPTLSSLTAFEENLEKVDASSFFREAPPVEQARNSPRVSQYISYRRKFFKSLQRPSRASSICSSTMKTYTSLFHF